MNNNKPINLQKIYLSVYLNATKKLCDINNKVLDEDFIEALKGVSKCFAEQSKSLLSRGADEEFLLSWANLLNHYIDNINVEDSSGDVEEDINNLILPAIKVGTKIYNQLSQNIIPIQEKCNLNANLPGIHTANDSSKSKEKHKI